MVEKSGVEKFLFALGLKSSWLKSPGLKGLGLKLGVEKSGVEMSFNRSLIFNLLILWFLKINLGFRCNVCTSAYLVQFLTMVPKLSPPPLWIKSNHF